MARSQAAITREGWYYLLIIAFVFAGAVLRELNLLVVIGAIMLAPLILSWRLVKSALLSIAAERQLPSRVGAGDTFQVNLVGRNERNQLPCWAAVAIDRITPQADGADAVLVEAMFPPIPARQHRCTSYSCVLPRRGWYRFGPLTIYSSFPWGLIRAFRHLPAENAVLACPRLGHLTTDWIDLIESQRAGDRRGSQRRGPMEGDYYATRPWRSGDSKRWIHWRASARLGTLMVREYERRMSTEVAVCVDLWSSARGHLEQASQLELAVSFAATVVSDLCHRGGTNLTLAVAADPPAFWHAPATPVLAQQIMEYLARVEGTADPLELSRAFEQLRGHSRSRGQPVVISTRGYSAVESLVALPRAGFTAGSSRSIAAPWSKEEAVVRTATNREAPRGVAVPAARPLWVDVSSDLVATYFYLD